MYRSKELPRRSPTGGVPRLRGPDPPSGLLPFSGRHCRPDVACIDRLLAMHAARPSSTSIGRCSPGRAARCSPTRCAPPDWCHGRSRASASCTGCSTRSARRCRRWRSPARRWRSSKGRSRAAVQAAAESVAERLASMVQPFAESVFARHRAAGRPLVLATTTPYDLVKPFADLLGLDDVVATRYGVNADGTYDGTLAGPFVWSSGKLAAVREWADDQRRRPRRELRLLRQRVRRPAAVGGRPPDRGQPRPADGGRSPAARRWPVLNLDVSPGVVKIPFVGLELQRLAMQFTRPSLVPYAHFEIDGRREHARSAGRRSSSPTIAPTSTRWRSRC